MKTTTILAFMLIALGSASFAEGDAEKGERVFKKCASCHSNEDGKNKLGPSLFAILGRQAGSVDGFKYSSAMAEAGYAWDSDHLNGFLENPKKYLKGTKMSFPGLKSSEDITNLIAYLETLK